MSKRAIAVLAGAGGLCAGLIIGVLAPVGDWTSAVTAIGTVLVAVVAVGIAIWSERRTDKRLADEREHSNAQLTTEREHADTRMALQQGHSDRQLRKERQRAQDAEQFAEAYAVQVMLAEKPTGAPTDPVDKERNADMKSLVAIIVNHGRFTITRVEARFRSAGGAKNLVTHRRTELLTSYPGLDERLRRDLWGSPDYNPYVDRLAPWDTGIRIESAPMAGKFLLGAYPVVRWTDRWGTRWEHKLGEVRRVHEPAPWVP